MIDSEKKQFLESINGIALVYRVNLSKAQVRIYWDILKEYQLGDVLESFSKHLKTSRFFPTPVDLLDLIPASKANQHVSAEEAWAIALEAMDEYSTVVVTDAILEAKTICQDVYDSGDKIGARMAFKDAYNRIIKTAPKPAWKVSEGYDKARREDVVRKAVALGRLTQSEDSRYLTHQEPDKKSKEIAQGIFEKMKMSLQFQTDEEKIAAREKRRQDFENYRKAELQRLSEKLKG